MKNQAPFRLTGALLLAAGLLLITCFELLRQTLDYPNVLRESSARILALHAPAVVGAVQPLWYGMTLGSLCMVFGMLLLDYCLRHFRVPYRALITTVGLLAALFNVFGYLRWVFLVPGLAAAYAAPTATAATREAVVVVFNAFHLYLGFSVGEHLGFLFLGMWGLLLSVALYRTAAFPRWLAWVGVPSSVGTILGILEGAGWAPAAQIVEISASLLIGWIMLLGICVWRRREGLIAPPEMPTLAPSHTAAHLARKAAALVVLGLLGAGGAQAQQAPERQPGPASRFAPREISVNGFRNPSLGLEYRYQHVSVHAGYYPTNFTSGRTTSFLKTGLTLWFLPVGRQANPSSFYASGSYLRGVDREYEAKNGVAVDIGFRWMVWKGLNLRLGIIGLKAPGRDLEINPTPGISYSFFPGRQN
ncbi:DUF4386 domain-containing protein [Hymenobacter terrenus]|uniref:DUF4386 domain-containing protein n=1 Tax=Hymenobacter terrenus TaxID=1629124 RepID=UPI0009E3A3CF|nr:DUF4386 domain-containing protein [Hymenobacter terrenus]